MGIAPHTLILGMLAALALAPPGASPAAAQGKTITVFAAASLKNALDDIGAAFAKATGLRVVASYAASAALLRQIEQGAPADLLLSADVAWMDYAARNGLIRNDTRFDLLGNSLVLIAPKASRLDEMFLVPYFDLAGVAGDGRIVIGDVRTVPAGRYAKAALERLGIWASVERRLAMAENVRAALALVARGEAPLGIVYATDARIEPNVKVVGVFAPDPQAPIVYPAALTAAARPEAAAFLDYLRAPPARRIFEDYGFTVLVRPHS